MLVQGFDHFVVPVNDIVVAEDFYSQVFGGKVVKRHGLTVRSRSLGPHTFITVAGKRIGVYLQKEERGTPITRKAHRLTRLPPRRKACSDVIRALEEWKIKFAGPVKNTHSFAASTIFFADPAGNNFAVYVPTVEENNGTTERLTGVGYLELEAPDLDASIKFYEQVLGFKVLERGRDAQSNKPQATMRMASGQYFDLDGNALRPQGLSDEPADSRAAFGFLRRSRAMEGCACPARPARHSQRRPRRRGQRPHARRKPRNLHG